MVAYLKIVACNLSWSALIRILATLMYVGCFFSEMRGL